MPTLPAEAPEDDENERDEPVNADHGVETTVTEDGTVILSGVIVDDEQHDDG